MTSRVAKFVVYLGLAFIAYAWLNAIAVFVVYGE